MQVFWGLVYSLLGLNNYIVRIMFLFKVLSSWFLYHVRKISNPEMTVIEKGLEHSICFDWRRRAATVHYEINFSA